MQTRRIRLQAQQLELFRPQSEVIDWCKLPRETQHKTITLLAKLLREDTGTRPKLKEGNHE
jgi:hypothetical protein